MNFTIKGTATTPSIDYRDGCLKIEGKLFPLDYKEFFKLFLNNMNDNISKSENELHVDVALTLTNAASKRGLMKLFNALEELSGSGTDIDVNWRYKSDNEDIHELGEIIKSRFNLDMKMKNDE